jgi:hypothetical protein
VTYALVLVVAVVVLRRLGKRRRAAQAAQQLLPDLPAAQLGRRHPLTGRPDRGAL